MLAFLISSIPMHLSESSKNYFVSPLNNIDKIDSRIFRGFMDEDGAAKKLKE